MTVLLPTAYLPPISYMAACVEADKVWIEAWETYPKQTLRNHCEIGGQNGRLRLTIPVNRPNGNHTKTKDVRIAKHLPWQKIHWKSFEAAYNKSPYFLYYQDYLIPYYEKEFTYLIDFNLQLLETIFQAIRLDKSVSLTESYLNKVPGAIDLRQASGIRHPEYYQVFADRHGFQQDLSVVDLLFNLGPEVTDFFRTFAFPYLI
ncbi:MAG: WbqC family protein [Bacteroidales bacterium]|nr:WbqC family protein [Bacteroidales bacterium]